MDREVSTASRYDLNAEFWVKIIREDLDRYRTELTNSAIISAVGSCEDSQLLDAGCGEGYLSRFFAMRGAHTYGIDSSSALIDAAQLSAKGQGLNIQYSIGDVNHTHFAAEQFDIVVANHLLNDLPRPDVAIMEFSRILRPGGRLAILMLHPCFYGFHAIEGSKSRRLTVADYFALRTTEQQFHVAGILSPEPVSVYIRSLEYYFQALTSAGFQVTALQEPRPSGPQLEDEWWQTKFTTPLFILFTASKGWQHHPR
jgi:2-polyprenyl-3-methyl-5-hydroxy-6-metoxy-1,4-benzoquinol methylase